jgi:AraC-like DNA-binding protein
MDGAGGVLTASFDASRPPFAADFAECALLAGGLEAVARLRLRPQHRGPQVLLVHDVETHDSSMLLTQPQAAAVAVARQARVVALAAPRARVGAAALAPATELRQTPLVRASRSMLVSLLTDLEHHGRCPGARVDEVLVNLMRGIVLEHPEPGLTASPEATMGERLRAFIDARHADPRLGVAQVAQEFGISRRQLYRHAGGEGGVATMLTRRRLATALELLEAHHELTVAEVAVRSGFGSASRLRSQLAVRLGVTPLGYRRAVQGTE